MIIILDNYCTNGSIRWYIDRLVMITLNNIMILWIIGIYWYTIRNIYWFLSLKLVTLFDEIIFIILYRTHTKYLWW